MGKGERVTFAGERIVNCDRRWCCVVYGIKFMYYGKYIGQQVAPLLVAITVLDALQASYTNIRV
jgi:hypothetical protein